MTTSTVVQDVGAGRIIIADQVHPSLQIVYDADLGTWHTVKSDAGRISTTNYVWDTGALAWARMTQPGASSGGGAATIADGADIVEGSLADAAIITDVAGTVSGKLRGLVKILASVWNSGAGNLRVDGSAVVQPVSGTFWPGTQPVSGTFWQLTQPVSLASTTITGSVAVTGTFWQATQPVSGTFWQATQPVSIATWSGLKPADTLAGVTTVAAVTAITNALPTGTNTLGSVKLTDGTNVSAVKAASTAAATTDPGQVVNLSPNSPAGIRPATLVVTATAAANTALTITIPSGGAGLFHYITRIEISRTATAALAGSATLVVTTTNLPGSLAFSFGNAMVAGGTQKDLDVDFTHPLKSSVAATATTIVAPAPGAAVLWRMNVFYYTAP